MRNVFAVTAAFIFSLPALFLSVDLLVFAFTGGHFLPIATPAMEGARVAVFTGSITAALISRLAAK